MPVMCVNCAELTTSDVNSIIETVLFEFPIKEINIRIPNWIEVLSEEHWLRKAVYSAVAEKVKNVEKIRHTRALAESLSEFDFVKKSEIEGMDLGDGTVVMEITAPENLFYKVLGETSGFEIENEERLISLMGELAEIKREYDKVAFALKQVKENGYGIVSPEIEELTLAEPEIVRHGGRFGIRLKASAPSIHMIRADIETEVNPIVGTEKQSEELVHYILEEFETDPEKIWESNIFGKSLHELVNEGLHNKLSRMPDDARYKLQETLQRIINEGSGGLICIIL